MFQNIEVAQQLKFVNGPTTARPDTVEISYTIWNKDSREHNIGIRILLDTYLGREDGAPFKTPLIGDIVTEKFLEKDQIPQYWYSYDDLAQPTVRAQGTLIIPGFPVPDKIGFASWERFNKYLWDFQPKEGRTFRRAVVGPPDSAVAIYFEPKKFYPNDSFAVKTYYGLYGAAIYKGKVFNISLSGPVTTKGEPFTITADVQNISPNRIDNVTAEILLPAQLKLKEMELQTKSLQSMQPKEIKKTSWNTIPIENYQGTVEFKVKITGTSEGNMVTEYAERKITILPTEIKPPAAPTAYILFDFTEINKLIKEMNELIQKNNEKLDQLNEMIKFQKPYTKENALSDRNSIKQREEKVQNIEKKLPDAVKSAVKEIKK
jgi:hypothetical protein